MEKFQTWLINNRRLLSVLFFLFVTIVFICVFLNENVFALSITRNDLKFWTGYITLLAFGFTIYKLLTLQNQLNVSNKTILVTNNMICQGLVDDIINMINSPNTDYYAVNLVRDRMEVHLEYCQQCCSSESEEQNKYKQQAIELSRFETALRSRIKSAKNTFDDDTFVETLKSLKKFLLKRDLATIKYGINVSA